jgi:hypothetical protein
MKHFNPAKRQREKKQLSCDQDVYDLERGNVSREQLRLRTASLPHCRLSRRQS